MSQNHQKNLLWLDLLRGLAAVIVMAGHLRSVMFIDFEDIEAPNSVAKLFYFITGFGHQAVIIFFVLSGFFIIRSVKTSYDLEVWSWRVYFVNRLTRLWMVLIPGLFLGLFWDKLGLFLYPSYDVYTGVIEHLSYFNPNEKLELYTFLGNALFLQTIFVETFGTNGALWSLSNEFWYYIAFPLIFYSYKRARRVLNASISFIIALAIIWAFDFFAMDNATHPALYFLIWLLGGVALWLSPRLAGMRYITLFSSFVALILVVILTGIRLKMMPLLFNDYSLGITSCLLVAFLSNMQMKLRPLKTIAMFLSSISYTLYVVHLPIAVFISAYCFERRAVLNIETLLIYSGVFFLIILYSRVVYFFFERNTDRVKKLLLR